MDEEFRKVCMERRTKIIEPTAMELSNPLEIEILAKSHNVLSNYFLNGAELLLESNSPLLAVLLAYFAMEQKTYEILALKGLKVTSHLCAIKGLSRVIVRKDLASILSKAYDNRLEVNYLGNIKTADVDRQRAKKFIDETAKPFIEDINAAIQELKEK